MALAESADGGPFVLGRIAIKRELSLIARTGTSSSRDRALQALDRIMERDAPPDPETMTLVKRSRLAGKSPAELAREDWDNLVRRVVRRAPTLAAKVLAELARERAAAEGGPVAPEVGPT